MMQKKVLFYITNPQRMAGSNRAIYEVIKHLSEEYAPSVLFSDAGIAPDYFKENQLKVSVVKPEGIILNSYGKRALQLNPLQKGFYFIKEYLPYALRLYKFLKEMKPAIVHVNDVRSLFLIGPVAKLLRIKILLHIHTEYYCPPGLWKLMKRLPTKMITVSQYVIDHMRGGQEKAVRIYNGIKDLSKVEGEISTLKQLSNDGVVVVGCFASIIPFKSVHYLVDAAKILNDKGYRNKIHFVSVGPQPDEQQEYQKWLYKKVSDSKLDNFEFAGWQSNPASYYRSIDICVLPSVSSDSLLINGQRVAVQGNEGFPTTNLEAMLFGLPIVATSISGTPEQVKDGWNGYLVPPANPEALADAIEKLVLDKSKRSQFGKNGFQLVHEEFTLDKCVSQFESVLKAI